MAAGGVGAPSVQRSQYGLHLPDDSSGSGVPEYSSMPQRASSRFIRRTSTFTRQFVLGWSAPTGWLMKSGIPERQ